MTREEIDRKKDIEAMVMLEKSGVGPMFAKAQLTPFYVAMIKELGNAGSENEAIVKVALQFAFSKVDALRDFAFEESLITAHMRKFRARR